MLSLFMRATAEPKPLAAVIFMDLRPPAILNLVYYLRIGIGLGFIEAMRMKGEGLPFFAV